MSRGYRFGVFAALWIFAITIHYLAIRFFRPSGDLRGLVDESANAFISSGYGDQIYLVFSQFLPLLIVGFAVAWLLFTEYEEQTVGQRRRR